jgi:hypothetical protein
MSASVAVFGVCSGREADLAQADQLASVGLNGHAPVALIVPVEELKVDLAADVASRSASRRRPLP